MQLTEKHALILYALKGYKNLRISDLARIINETEEVTCSLCELLSSEEFSFLKHTSPGSSSGDKKKLLYSLTSDGLFYARRIVREEECLLPDRFLLIFDEFLTSETKKISLTELKKRLDGKSTQVAAICLEMYEKELLCREVDEQNPDKRFPSYVYYISTYGNTLLESNRRFIEIPRFLPKVNSVWMLASV